MNSVEDAVKNADVIVFSCDKKGIITLQEGGGLKQRNIKPNQHVGLCALETFKELSGFVNALKVALNGESTNTVYKWGEDFCETHLRPQINGGVVGICTVQTERVLKERENIIRAKMIVKEQYKQEFMAIVSHEIRNSVSGIIGLIDIFKSEQKSNSEYLDLLEKTSHELLQLTNDYLDYSKIEKGMVEINNIEFNFGDVITDSISTYTGLLRDITVEKIPSGNDYIYLGDPFRIKQVILNLLGNAIKFTNTKITIIYKTTSTDISLNIIDDGIGFSKDKNLFGEYQQEDNTIFQKYGGTGLGLSICKMLITAMRGNIGCHSDGLNCGADFWFTLPLTSTIKSTEIHLKEIKILIIDNNLCTKLLLSKLLHSLGYSDIYICDNESEACILLQKQTFNVCFIDTFDIFDISKLGIRIKSIITLKVILISDNNVNFDNQYFDDILTKPINKKTLYQVLN